MFDYFDAYSIGTYLVSIEISVTQECPLPVLNSFPMDDLLICEPTLWKSI